MAHEQELGIAHDDRQQIVEVVRDATGQLPNSLHFLGLREFGLQRLLLRDVDEVEECAPGPLQGADEELRHAFALTARAQLGGCRG